MDALAAGARVSIADGRKAFVAAFMPERDLWEVGQDVLGLDRSWVPTKVLPRRLA